MALAERLSDHGTAAHAAQHTAEHIRQACARTSTAETCTLQVLFFCTSTDAMCAVCTGHHVKPAPYRSMTAS